VHGVSCEFPILRRRLERDRDTHYAIKKAIIALFITFLVMGMQ